MHGFKLLLFVVVVIRLVSCLSTLYPGPTRKVQGPFRSKTLMSNMREKFVLFCLRRPDSPLCQQPSQRNANKAVRKVTGVKSSKMHEPSQEYRTGDNNKKDTDMIRSSTNSLSTNSMVCQFTSKAEFLMFKMAVKVAKNEAIDAGRNLRSIKDAIKDLVALPQAFMKCDEGNSETKVLDGQFLIKIGKMVSKKKSPNHAK